MSLLSYLQMSWHSLDCRENDMSPLDDNRNSKGHKAICSSRACSSSPSALLLTTDPNTATEEWEVFTKSVFSPLFQSSRYSVSPKLRVWVRGAGWCDPSSLGQEERDVTLQEKRNTGWRSKILRFLFIGWVLSSCPTESQPTGQNTRAAMDPGWSPSAALVHSLLVLVSQQCGTWMDVWRWWTP